MYEKTDSNSFIPLADSPETTVEATEKATLEKVLWRESDDMRQWRLHVLNIFLVGVSLTVNLLRGSPKTPSIIDIKKCGAVDWTLLTCFVVFALCVTSINVSAMRY